MKGNLLDSSNVCFCFISLAILCNLRGKISVIKDKNSFVIKLFKGQLVDELALLVKVATALKSIIDRLINIGG